MKKDIKDFQSNPKKQLLTQTITSMTKIILPLDFLFWGGMQTAACGDEERMTEPTVSSGLLPNQGNQEIPANELQQYID